MPEYVALSALQERGRPSAVHVTDGTRHMLLPLVIRNIPGGGLDARSPYGYPGPVGIGTDDPDFLGAALAVGLHVMREAELVSAFVRLHPLLNPSPPVHIGTVVRHGETVSIDLTLPTDDLWAQTRLNHRRDITRTAGLGYTAGMDEEWKHLAAFKEMYRVTMTRNSADPFYFFQDTYFDDLRRALGERLHLCVVQKGDLVASAGLFAETDGIVEYHLSGTADAFRSIQPTKLMMHFVRGWAKDRGNEVMHLGGGVSGNNDSLMHFKVGFSPRRHTFSTLRLVVDETEYGRLVAVRDAGPDLGTSKGFFPAYRSTEV